MVHCDTLPLCTYHQSELSNLFSQGKTKSTICFQAFISARLLLSSIQVAIAMNYVLVCLLAFSQRSPLSWYGEHQSQAGWRDMVCIS